MSRPGSDYGTGDAPHGVRETGSGQVIRPGEVQLEADTDLEQQYRTGHHNGGGGGRSSRPEIFEQRAQVLTQPPGQSSRYEAPRTMPVQVELTRKTSAQVASFQMQDAVMRRNQRNGLRKDALWLEGGSLASLPGEEVICRHAGTVTDVFEIYCLSTFLMMTDRRVMIKTIATLFGINSATVEESFLYSDLKHVSVKRVTNLWSLAFGIGLCLVGILLFGLGALWWFFAIIGIVFFLPGLCWLYWFSIFYNSNTLVLDFSKPNPVGSWWIGKGEGAYIVKSVFLRIDLCFEIMYRLYNHSKTNFKTETA